MKDKFSKALENNDMLEMRKIPKSDLHNHGTRGGNKRYIEEWSGVSIPNPPRMSACPTPMSGGHFSLNLTSKIAKLSLFYVIVVIWLFGK